MTFKVLITAFVFCGVTAFGLAVSGHDGPVAVGFAIAAGILWLGGMLSIVWSL